MENMQTKVERGKGLINIEMPPVIFGTSSLGNLFEALTAETKLGIVKECVHLSKEPVVFDSAGKYGAGMALEVLGQCLKQLNVGQEDVMISNKLGWLRTELKTAEPTFEPGVWKDLENDAVQKISYDGIMECFEQGNELLNGYIPQLLSVHDPDEYLATATDEQEAQQFYENILDAYEALFDLKQQGKVKGIGVGARDWRMIQRISGDVALDWVMIANSMTIKTHLRELFNFIRELHQKGVYVINSAVFHSGFLVGGDYYDYRQVKRGPPANDALFEWRKTFFEVCRDFAVKPTAACVQFALHVPGVKSIALNTSDEIRVKENLEMAELELPVEFWETLHTKGLIHENVIHTLPV